MLLFFGRPKIFGMTKKKLVLPNRKIEKPKIQERFSFWFFASLFLVIPFFSFFCRIASVFRVDFFQPSILHLAGMYRFKIYNSIVFIFSIDIYIYIYKSTNIYIYISL